MAHDRLRIYLFGEPRFETREAPYVLKAPPKTLPLLAYLLLNRRSPIRREKVAEALWPDCDQAAAYSNLRRHLHYLVKSLPDTGVPWIVATQKTVGWNLLSAYWLDVEEFESGLNDRAQRAAAVRLYSGDLYESCFEDWIVFERERLRTLQLSALAELCGEARERSAYVEALQYAQLVLATDRWREDAIRLVMETRMLLGDRAGAIDEYERFRARLREELQTEPLAETAAIYERLRSAETSAPAPRSKRTGVQLVGRHNELATLRDEWQRAARGEGRTVFLGGEAGIGKTALLRALADFVAENGGAVLEGAAAPDEDIVYAAFAGIAQELGADLFTPLAGGDAQVHRFEDFADRLSRLAEGAKLLIALEDLHWADHATLALLQYLSLRLAGARILFVCTYREFGTHRSHPLRNLRRQLSKTRRFMNLPLSAMNREDAFALARSHAERDLPHDVLENLYRRSDGNPLFVVELARALGEHGAEDVPASIAHIVAGRVSRLAPEEASLLETAAVAGPAASTELLVQVTGVREADALRMLDRLIAERFLRQSTEDRFCFAHEVIRQAIYEQIPSERARSIHARTGFAIRMLDVTRSGAAAASAAWHFRSGNIPDAAAECSLAAAEHALSLYATDEAARHAKIAYELASSDADRFRALQTLETVAALHAQRREQEAFLDELLRLGEMLPEAERFDALVRAVDFSASGTPEEQRAALARLREHVERAPHREAAYLLREGEHLMRIGGGPRARALLDEAFEKFSREGNVEALARCLTALYTVALYSGDPLDDLQLQVRQVRSRLGKDGDARLRARLAHVQCGALIDRDPAAAYGIAAEMLEAAQSADDVWLEALAHRSLGACATRLMLIGKAQEHLRQSARIAVMAGKLRDVSRTRSWQMLAENRSADFVKARAFAEEGLDAARSCGAADVITTIHANLSNTASWLGDLDEAERNARESLRIGAEHGYEQSAVLSVLGEILIAKGRLREGTGLLERARAKGSPQNDLLGVHRVHFPVLLGLAYLALGREAEARTCACAVAGNISAFESYYVHPQAYLWSAAQLLRMVDEEERARKFERAARKRRSEILGTIDGERSRETFKSFAFNRMIEGRVRVSDPLHAWYLTVQMHPAQRTV